MSFDLSAAVAAEENAPFEFTYKGQAFSLPIAIPVSVIKKLTAVAQEDLEAILTALLGEADGPRFLALDPTDVELQVLLKEYGNAKGVDLGKLLS